MALRVSSTARPRRRLILLIAHASDASDHLIIGRHIDRKRLPTGSLSSGVASSRIVGVPPSIAKRSRTSWFPLTVPRHGERVVDRCRGQARRRFVARQIAASTDRSMTHRRRKHEGGRQSRRNEHVHRSLMRGTAPVPPGRKRRDGGDNQTL